MANVQHASREICSRNDVSHKASSPWSSTDDATLTRLWSVEKATSGEIARTLGRTRNAVIGRINRLQLMRKGPRVHVLTPRRPVARAAKPRTAKPKPSASLKKTNGYPWAPDAFFLPYTPEQVRVRAIARRAVLAGDPSPPRPVWRPGVDPKPAWLVRAA